MENLFQLKDKVADVATDVFANDWYLMMWLKFHKMDVLKTEAAIRKSVGYRQKFGFGTDSKSEFPEAEPNELPFFWKVGKDGLTPVIIVKAGSLKFRSLRKKYGKDNLMRMVALTYYEAEKEFMQRVNATDGDLDTKCKMDFSVLHITDYNDFTLTENSHPSALDMFLHVCKIGYQWLPLFGWTHVMLNASTIAWIVIQGMQMFMKGSFYIFREQDDGWKDIVSNYVELDAIIAVLEA